MQWWKTVGKFFFGFISFNWEDISCSKCNWNFCLGLRNCGLDIFELNCIQRFVLLTVGYVHYQKEKNVAYQTTRHTCIWNFANLLTNRCTHRHCHQKGQHIHIFTKQTDGQNRGCGRHWQWPLTNGQTHMFELCLAQIRLTFFMGP